MAERLYRAQVLLEPEQHKALAALAERRGMSISRLVREIVEQYLVEQDVELEQHLAALERIRRLREEILARRGGQPLDIDVPALIEEIRDERDRELWDAAFGAGGRCQPDDRDAAAGQ
ncbi:MAG TPA: CopG family transcriptional regulator [Anaerolineae bacterium]|nr:CopG family transcriptional regulator [Anaerolineae bacterium]HOR01299.1 CopG family transcriptional regulator [Anaerolineae bacterium]HPL27148.1 CopG family transcriptional regulator [Anaerolineae bacterium]